MRIKYIAALVFSVIFIGLPFSVFASDDEINHNLGGSEVICTVPEIYDFSVPEYAVITYPKTYIVLGDFTIGDILLKSKETLSINVTPGELRNSDYTIEYDISFDPPKKIDGTMCGEKYAISIDVEESDFDNANPGSYSASIIFQVVSNSSNKTVWQETVYIEAFKQELEPSSQPGRSTNEQKKVQDEPSSNESVSVNNDQIKEEQVDEPIPAAINEDTSGEDSEADFVDEKMQSGLTRVKSDMLLWIAAACGVLLLVLLFGFVIMNRKNRRDKT